jgi:hypothetical protein
MLEWKSGDRSFTKWWECFLRILLCRILRSDQISLQSERMILHKIWAKFLLEIRFLTGNGWWSNWKLIETPNCQVRIQWHSMGSWRASQKQNCHVPGVNYGQAASLSVTALRKSSKQDLFLRWFRTEVFTVIRYLIWRAMPVDVFIVYDQWRIIFDWHDHQTCHTSRRHFPLFAIRGGTYRKVCSGDGYETSQWSKSPTLIVWTRIWMS